MWMVIAIPFATSVELLAPVLRLTLMIMFAIISATFVTQNGKHPIHSIMLAIPLAISVVWSAKCLPTNTTMFVTRIAMNAV